MLSEHWDYKTTHEDISYTVHQRLFQSENIGFGKPSQDECDFVQSTAHAVKTLMELMMSMHVSNAMLAKIIRKKMEKLVLITAKTGIKMPQY